MKDKKKDAKEVAAAIAEDVYEDGGKPIVKPTGELLGLIPRAIKAALAPLEKWILQKEYNIAATKKLLEKKLKNIEPENIQPPEAHIAVPALQYISYCMDNDELRDMYANLLANSMNKAVKNGVHPGFVEIIKQLCPDEAKILKYMHDDPILPTITLRQENDKGSGFDVIKNFSDVGVLAGCEKPQDISVYFDNLIRLGLLDNDRLSTLTNKDFYNTLKNNEILSPYKEYIEANKDGFNKIKFEEGKISITEYGKQFCNICITV